MKNKIFLSSMLIMSVAPAMAEPSNTDEFPTGGLMQEDYTYTGAATEANMGVYEGSVNATAEYDTIDYILTAGKYLPADSETITPCLAGSFCAGGKTVQYNQSSDQGIQTCPTGYASSAAGASSDTQCYRACDVNNMGENGSISSIAHATAISGNDYYGSGTDTCAPTECENGWHVGGLDVVAKTQLVPLDYTDSALSRAYKNSLGETWDNDNYLKGTLTDNNTWAMAFEDGIVYGRASCNDDTVNTYIQNNNTKVLNGTMTIQQFMEGFVPIAGQEKANWLLNIFQEYVSGNLSEAEMSARGSVIFGKDNSLNPANITGNFCFCQLTGYQPNGGQKQSISDAIWVPKEKLGSNNCSHCAGYCAELANTTDQGLRGVLWALYGAFTKIGSSCEANTITINWSNADASDVSANNAGTATYGSDVRTPVKAQTIKGKTFKGWRFSKPTQTTTGN